MIIDEINKITGERGRDYGHPLPNHLRASIDWTMKNNFQFTENPILVAEKLGNGLKGVRVIETPKYDSYRDEVGYVHCIDQMCKLYYEYLCDVGIMNGGNTYEELDDTGKTVIIETLKQMDIVRQLELLINIIKYLDKK